MRYFVPNMETIPHGSGINGNWEIEEKNRKWRFSNFYHGMNEFGFYDGYADFSVTVNPFDSGDFRIMFHNSPPRHKSWFYGLLEYLEDTFAQWIKENTMEILD
jgi:hypothetical protein